MNPLLSAPEVASVLGVELDTLYRYARRGDLRGIKIGKLWRFADADVEEFIQRRRHPHEPPTITPKLLLDLLGESAGQTGRPEAVICGSRRLILSDLDFLSDRLAAALLDNEVHSRDRVVVLLPNSVEFVIACFAIWKVGGVVVPEDSAIRSPLLAHILEETQPAALIADRTSARRLEEMQQALSSLKAIFVKDQAFTLSGASIAVQSLDEVLERERTSLPQQRRGAAPDDVVSISYTSGSTGASKGVMHTHESWLAAAAFTRDYLELSRKDTLLIPLPLHHAYAFRQILAYLLAGGTIVIAADVYQGLKALREQRPTALLLVPAACNIIIDHFAAILAEADPFLRYIEMGTAPTVPERLQALRELVPTTPVHLPYGLTEARVGFLKSGPDGLLNRIATVSPGLQVEVVDGRGRAVDSGQMGEIRLKGQGLMKGYWGAPNTEQASLKESGFRTGDMGRSGNKGEIALLGRIDDVLKIGGRKVNPVEVETVLNRYPQVVESAVAGRPDPRGILEQELHAFVVPLKGAKLTEKALMEHCRKHLEPYKLPAKIYLRASLPKSSVGKVQRHILAKESIGA